MTHHFLWICLELVFLNLYHSLQGIAFPNTEYYSQLLASVGI
jgi:hypothetical protein